MNPIAITSVSLRIFSACFLGTLLCSCASTTIKSTWKSPKYQGGRFSKVALLAITDRGLLRQGFENRLAIELGKGGVTTTTTFNLMSLSEISNDKPAAAARLRSTGAQALVMMRLVDSTTYFREFRVGPEDYAQYVTGMNPGPWYDYYSVAYMDMSPTYGSSKQKVYLETVLFDLNDGQRVWSGLTETVLTDNMDRVAEMDPIVQKVVAGMRKDGMVP